ncbi:hypothetical protein ACJJTC_009052 [Scirpophaga incertulas]
MIDTPIRSTGTSRNLNLTPRRSTTKRLFLRLRRVDPNKLRRAAGVASVEPNTMMHRKISERHGPPRSPRRCVPGPWSWSRPQHHMVMQELGYIDHNLEPNYEHITQRISDLPVSAELKGDIQDGLQFCRKFSQCVPDVKRDVAPLSQELIKPMFFFRCYKHKKLEACIMKDIRERFTTEEELDTDTDFSVRRSLSRSARAARDEPLPDLRFEALDEMAVYLYDFLSQGNGLDLDWM